MSAVTVKSQVELDAALKAHGTDPEALILIDSPRGVWLALTSSGSATVEACGSATVRASGSATVRAYDSATVRASDSATVEASDSATVRASGSATVEAYGSATVRASGSATVRASKYAAVHPFSAKVQITGGVVIDVAALDLTDAATWCEYHGVEVDLADARATLYKAVDANLKAGHSYTLTEYPIGGTVTAPDWQATPSCGHGLHVSPTPFRARDYYSGQTEPRFLAVSVALADLVPLDDKAKAPTLRVLHEVNIHGEPIEVAS